jgi:hypothetical protein
VESDALSLAIDKIMDRIYSQLEYKYAWTAKDCETEYKIVVRDIVLGLSVLQVKDRFDSVLLVPTWYIFHTRRRG